MNSGVMTIGDKVYNFIDLYRDEDANLIVIIDDDNYCNLGQRYLTSLEFVGLDQPYKENITFVGNSKHWSHSDS